MKMRFKRFLSGFMAVATLASVIVQPVTVSASELEPEPTSFEQQYPELQDVQDTLDKDEIVEAKDIEIPYGEEFEVEVDLSGIEGVNEKKVKVLFHEAKSEAGTDFDAHTPDTYKAVYAVEPVSGHPAYRVSRNITVKEPETEEQTKSSSENTAGEGNAGETEDSGNADEDADSDGSKEIVTDLTDEQEVTTDEESGLAVSEVMDQAAENGIDLYSMEEGEAVTFMATDIATQSTKKVTVTRGTCYQYSDYGYGSYLTYKYTVQFGNVSATAYCVEPSKSSPGSGTYDITKLSDGKKLAKVCYYGTKASGDEGFFTEENGYGNLSAGARFILVHLAASYANGGDSAFSGASGTAKTLAMKLYNYCISQPEIPDVDLSFSDAYVTAYVDGNSQRTKEIIFKADELQSITMKLPSGVKLHNVTTGKTSKAGEAVEISGGTKFYLSAPLTQVQDVAGNWSATMKGSVTKDYSAYKISTGSGSQDLALVFGEGVDDEKYVDFKVTWVQYASVKVIKRDAKADAKLAGAVFGLYSDANCTNLITKLPATDEMELDMVGDQRTALFIIISDTDDTFNFVVAMMYSQLFNLLCDRADDVHHGRLPYHVRILCDEFANIGQIPKFDKLIATIRSREISASIILQSQSQLKTIYKDAAETILGNCDTMLFLGGKESSTLKEISETLGKETIDLYNTSDTRGQSRSYGMNYQKTGKELMSRDELAVMDGSKCILQLRGVRPFFSDKFDITKHKRYKELSDYDKKNEFDVEAYMRHRMEVKLTRTQEFDLYEFSEESLAKELNTENKEAEHVKDSDT